MQAEGVSREELLAYPSGPDRCDVLRIWLGHDRRCRTGSNANTSTGSDHVFKTTEISRPERRLRNVDFTPCAVEGSQLRGGGSIWRRIRRGWDSAWAEDILQKLPCCRADFVPVRKTPPCPFNDLPELRW